VILPAAALALLACGEAARGLATGPHGRADALALVDALRARYGIVTREPSLAALRPKLASALMVPSRVHGDASVWSHSEGEWRAFWLEGGGAPGAYTLALRPSPKLPREPGAYRARVALSRLQPGRFEWSTVEETALGPLRPERLTDAFRALLRAAQAAAGSDARAAAVAAMPRSAEAFGRLFDVEALAVTAAPDATTAVALGLRLQPQRLRATMPRFAAYVAKYSRGLRLGVRALLPDGRALWALTVEDTSWRLRLRVKDGSLVPLEGAPAHDAARLRLLVDYTFKAGMFRIGVERMPVDVDPRPLPGQLAFSARFVEQPDWQVPFLVQPFMRASLRYPFEAPGSEFRLALRADPERGTLLVSDTRVRVRESWIVRWLGGFSQKALDDLRAAEAEADRFTLECLTALRADLAALFAG
jgi:hypothetical protein